MKKIDPIETWLNTVAFDHSDSEQTRRIYKSNFEKFLNYAETTAENILHDYNPLTTEREFKQKYTPIIMSLIGQMRKQNLAPATQHNVITAIKSFFKYNSLPLGYAPSGKQSIQFHNRDIEQQEIEEIINRAQPREKAYYTLMAQSGLRPQTISKLTIEDLDKLLDDNTPIPCLIKIPQDKTKGKYSEYFTFTGQESITYIKKYLKGQRSQPLTPEDYLFTMQDGKTPVKPDVINHSFKRTIEKLKTENVLDFKHTTKDMPNKKRKSVSRNELRLYSLRKYFRKQAGHAGPDYVNFWMGHGAKLGSDKYYFSTDVEQHRKQYKEKAMQHLTIETPTPDQFTPIVTDLQNKLTRQEDENKKLKERLTKVENILSPKENQSEDEQLPQQDWEQTQELIIEHEKLLKKHPLQFKKQQTHQKENDKWLEEYLKITEQEQELYRKHLETRIDKLEKTIKELNETIKNQKS